MARGKQPAYEPEIIPMLKTVEQMSKYSGIGINITILKATQQETFSPNSEKRRKRLIRTRLSRCST